jgi:hypothetical protein
MKLSPDLLISTIRRSALPRTPSDASNGSTTKNGSIRTSHLRSSGAAHRSMPCRNGARLQYVGVTLCPLLGQAMLLKTGAQPCRRLRHISPGAFLILSPPFPNWVIDSHRLALAIMARSKLREHAGTGAT